MTKIKRYPDPASLAHGAAELFIELAAEAVAARGLFTVALSGGSTPRALYQLLASPAFASRVDWSSIHVFWGDERGVPPDDPASNYRMARETLLDHVPIPAEHVHRIKGELPPEEAALAYEEKLRAFFSAHDLIVGNGPRFDFVLLGLGDNGHTASLFPGSSALHERSRWVLAQEVEATPRQRLTLTPLALNAAAHLAFLVEGEGKAEMVRKVLTSPPQPDTLPAQLIAPIDGTLYWLLDEAAGKLL